MGMFADPSPATLPNDTDAEITMIGKASLSTAQQHLNHSHLHGI